MPGQDGVLPLDQLTTTIIGLFSLTAQSPVSPDTTLHQLDCPGLSEATPEEWMDVARLSSLMSSLRTPPLPGKQTQNNQQCRMRHPTADVILQIVTIRCHLALKSELNVGFWQVSYERGWHRPKASKLCLEYTDTTMLHSVVLLSEDRKQRLTLVSLHGTDDQPKLSCLRSYAPRLIHLGVIRQNTLQGLHEY